MIWLVLGVAASAALADRRAQNPQELWRAYPLEQKPEKTAPAPGADGRASAPAQAQRASDADPPWMLIAGIGVASALLAGIAVGRMRRGPVLVDAPPAVPVEAPAPRPEPPHAALEPPARPPAARRPAAPPPSVGANGRAAPRRSPVCQIRWSRRGGWFYAVTLDNDGGEQRLGRSPGFDWAGPAPPEETPDARAALRRLAKDLRERGWRPLRAKGVDFDERRWYCRRFRWPTEAEVEAGRPGAGVPGREVAGRPGGER